MSTTGAEPFRTILEIELWLAAVICFAAVLVRLRRGERGRARRQFDHRISTTADIVSAFVFFGLAAAASFSAGRPVFGLAVAMPGSLVTRFTLFGIDPAGRRLIEPILLALLAAVLSKTAASGAVAARKRALLFKSWVVLLLIESLQAAVTLRFPAMLSGRDLLLINSIRLVLLQFILICSVLDALRWSRLDRGRRGGKSFREKRYYPGMLIGYAAAVGLAALVSAAPGRPPAQLQVGAHLYSWFPDNWSHGYFWKELRPPAFPLLGEYKSGDPDTVHKQAGLARGAGVDFFVLDWWPSRRAQKSAALETFNAAGAVSDLSFAVQIETLDLKDARDRRVKKEARDVIVLNSQRKKRLISTVRFIAREMMGKPQYLRFDNKPVLFFYATRHAVGPVAAVFEELRTVIRNEFGFELYIVGDEVYEQVVGESLRHGPLLLAPYEPNWDRLAAFDAITCYNPYNAERKELGGSAGAGRFIEYGSDLYRRYQAVADTLGLSFFPGVLPGYNDRGVRAKENHYVVPRELDRNGSHSFFTAALETWGRPFLDRRRPLLLVTSWNEWNEGTNIEPITPLPQTNDDSSGDARTYSGGEFFGGGGCNPLEELEAWRSNLEQSVQIRAIQPVIH